MKKQHSSILIITTISILILSCAKMGSLTGGAKDKTPPEVIRCKPNNSSTLFSQSIFTIYFNEYVRLNKINEKLLVSPPLDEAPEILLKGKQVEVIFNASRLAPNTTYNFNFSDAIADNNENNPMNGYVYAFSTGETIDSLSIKGQVIDAYTLLPVEGVYVLLYRSPNDTLFTTIRPDYLGRTDKEGNFAITYLADNAYSIYALKDENYNYIFDQATESIAFIDYRLRPRIVFDSISATNDSTISYRYVPDSVHLKLFTEDHLMQYITSVERKTPHKCKLIFSRPHIGEPIVFINNKIPEYIDYSQNFDTINLWLAQDSLYKKDSIEIICRYAEPLYSDSIRTDTVFATIDPKSTIKKGLSIELPKSKDIKKSYSIHLNHPATIIRNEKIQLVNEQDTSKLNIPVQTSISKNGLTINIEASLLEGEKYIIHIPDSTIQDVFGFENKADSAQIYIKTEEDYGHLQIELPKHTSTHLFIELISNDQVKYIQKADSGLVIFNYITPDIYSIRLVIDLNNNMIWDPGLYKNKQHCEPVYYHPEPIEIRNNWQHELTWPIQ